MKLRLFLLAWSLLWHLLLPVVLIYLWRRARREPAYGQMLAERFGRYRPTISPGAVWLHAVSLGEMRSAVPLVRALLDRGERVVTTHFTPAGRHEAARHFAADTAAGRLQSVWVPYETAWAWRGFFRAFRPRLGLVLEIEIWPRMIVAAKGAGVPLFMCNAQYPAKSLARDSRGLRLRQAAMRGFAGALVKSDLQATRFAGIGVRNIAVTGELRFDQTIPAAQVTAGLNARAWLGAAARPVITIASAVEDEDAVYLAAIAALRSARADHDQPMPLIVYVPRRPERFDEVAAAIGAAGLTFERRNRLFDAGLAPRVPRAATPDILLGDSLGEMFFYLAMADTVIVGGSFNPKGAHNIIEPLSLMKPVLTGPHVGTIEYPFVEAEAAGVVQRVSDAEALGRALVAGSVADPTRIAAFLAAHAGATARTLVALPGLLAAVRPS